MSEQEASRELDALIAANVLGWKPNPRYEDMPEYVHRMINPEGEARSVPHYTEDIAAAWQIINMWRNQEREGGYGEVEIRSEGPLDDGMWTVYFGVVSKGTAPTLPRAICKAALAATQSRGED